MTTPDEGMEYVDVHERWRYEDRHFTPWLADNLHMLGGALGMNLKLVQTEKPVGPFACDILAKELGSGERVAIENQLELTDHSHLGQLLTYAAGLNAGIAVWVAPDFQYEHAEALHRLNNPNANTRNGSSIAERSVPTSLRPSGYVGLSDGGGGYLARGKPNDRYTSGGGTGSIWPL